MKDVILVTGASGLVGNPLIKKLLADYQVIGLDLRKQTIDSSKYIHLRKKIKKVSDFLMIRRPPRSTQGVSSAASDVYKRQHTKLL